MQYSSSSFYREDRREGERERKKGRKREIKREGKKGNRVGYFESVNVRKHRRRKMIGREIEQRVDKEGG
jgi:hypothetical protein